MNLTCIVCNNPLPAGRRSICSDRCKAIRVKEQRHAVYLRDRQERIEKALIVYRRHHNITGVKTGEDHLYRVVDPGMSDYKPGALFSRVEMIYMLRLGYLAPGMVLSKNKQHYRVIGRECYPQDLCEVNKKRLTV